MKVMLYTTHCPRCEVLKKKLAQKNVSYEEITDVNIMADLGIKSVPQISLEGKLMNFTEATQWVNGLEG